MLASVAFGFDLEYLILSKPLETVFPLGGKTENEIFLAKSFFDFV